MDSNVTIAAVNSIEESYDQNVPDILVRNCD